MDTSIRKVVIVGRDAAAWISALALQRSFGRENGPGVEVQLVEQPSALRPQDAFLALPAQKALHRLLGLDENKLLRASRGLFSLGQRFSNWSGGDSAFLHAYDTQGISLSHVDFYQYWLKARAQGMNVALENFSLGAVAAKQGCFVTFNDENKAFSKAAYGYNLSALDYLKAIAKLAMQAGLEHTLGDVASVDIDNGRIRSITLGDGRRVKGDLFIDASGVEASLIGQLERRSNFKSWRPWMPCDRLLVASAPPLQPTPAFNQVSAFRHGWYSIAPLLDRSVVMAAYDSAGIRNDEALQTVAALSGLKLEGNAVAAPVSPGCREQQWIGNCVALGDSAVNLDPLDATHLQLLHTGLSWLVAMFPLQRHHMPEAEVFNAQMAAFSNGVRDFQAAHFKLNRRFDEPLWDAVREKEPPPTLARKLRLFGARGMVAIEENETFQEENWTAILNGHDLAPKTWDPQVDKVPDQELMAHFQRILGFIAGEVKAFPSVQAHLEMNQPQTQSDYIFG
jgi:tryptophan halogenase